jgi:putative tryptophan/tyrosine transport system substrate-binding protein
MWQFCPFQCACFSQYDARSEQSGGNMQRRQFILLPGGIAIGLMWPLRSSAQKPNMRRIGVLVVGNTDADAVSFQAELREELRKSGYVEGQNLIFDLKSADQKLDLLPKLAAELVAQKVDAIVALYTPCALAAKQATREIPIVAVSGDPVGTGLVSSLARPGGNLTGVSLIAAEMHGKCVELFRDMLPSLRRVGVIGNAADPFSKFVVEQTQLAGKTANIDIAPTIMVRGPHEIEAALANVKKEDAGAVVVQASLASKQVADVAIKYGLPAATVPRSFAEAGGMLSYGADSSNSFRQSARFVTKILQGGLPADMPIEQPTKFELIINLKTAKALGLTVAETFLQRADAIIE